MDVNESEKGTVPFSQISSPCRRGRKKVGVFHTDVKNVETLGRQVGSYFGDRIGFGLPAGVYFIIPVDQRLKPIRVVKVR